jgi:ABC-type dipeptide/oligopeptide/nickel transport system ATPase component
MLTVTDLTISFPSAGGHALTPIRDFCLSVGAGEIVGLAGASGCGKTAFASALLGILEPPGFVERGSAVFTRRDGTAVNLLSLTERQFRQVRGREIGIIFQDPLASLHQARTISAQFSETLRAHNVGDTRAKRDEIAAEWLDKMRLANPNKILASYPFEISGGMCQRVTIAMALAPRPRLLIADEPTTALDAQNQEQIMRLIREARDDCGASVILISHDLRLIERTCDRNTRMRADVSAVR